MKRSLSWSQLTSVAAACLVATLCGPPASPAEKDGEWTEVKSPNFTVMSNGGERSAVEIAKRFEQMRAVFARLLPVVDTGRPMLILGAKDEKTMKSLVPRYWDRRGGVRPAVVWQATPRSNYVILRSDQHSDDDEHYSMAYWGYASQLVARSYSRVPLWATQGLSEFYGYTSVQKERALVGRASAEHVVTLRQGIRIPLQRLFAIDHSSPEYLGSERRRFFDAESWALVHMLIVADKGAGRERFARFLEASSREGADPLGTVLQTLGDLKTLDGELRDYAARSSFYTFVLPAALQVSSKEFAARRLTSGESRAVLEAFKDDTSGTEQASGQTPAGPPAPSPGGDGTLRTTQSAVNRPCAEARWDECERLADALFVAGKGAYERTVGAAMMAKACDGKRVDACLKLAVWHDRGEYLTQDDGLATEFFEKACAAGKPSACVMAGHRRQIGKPAPSDAAKAFALYDSGCNAGDMDGCTRAGLLLRGGQGLPEDKTRAVVLLEKACRTGTRAACGSLGFLLLSSDPARAATLLQGSCEIGEMGSCAALGSLHLYGQGVPRDRDRAVSLLRKACEGGYKDACDHLSRMNPQP